MIKRMRAIAIYAICEIGGKVGTYGHALGRFGGRVEYWAAQRRDWPRVATQRGVRPMGDRTGQLAEDQADELAMREDRRRELARMSKRALCRMYRSGVRTPSGGVSQWVGGMHPPEQWEKSEVI